MISKKARCARAMFGLVGLPTDSLAKRLPKAAHTLLGTWEENPHQIALILGPSGSGKSRILNATRKCLLEQGTRVIDVEPLVLIAQAGNRRVVDLFDLPLDQTLGLLSRAGLADATLFAQRASRLSQGQQFRLTLALALARATHDTRPCVMIIDEMCSLLDRQTARCVCLALQRWLGRTPWVKLLCATGHDDIAQSLSPCVVTRVSMQGEFFTQLHDEALGEAISIVIEPGAARDYDALSQYHYRSGRPATMVHVSCAIDPQAGMLAGVLVISMPTLNGSWRQLAWPGRYNSGNKKADARRINEELRTISRVIIEPRYRGLGLAKKLVRSYLDEPVTPATEAVAAMGSVCPFFESAGMKAYALTPSPRDARFGDALDAMGQSIWSAMGGAVGQRVAHAALMQREIRRWAAASPITRRLVDTDPRAILELACGSAICGMAAYAHTKTMRGTNHARQKISRT